MGKHVALLTDRPNSDVEAALRRWGHVVARMIPGRGLEERLLIGAPDAVFIGLPSDGGRTQALLEGLGLPYTHSGVLPSALADHGHQAKVVLKAAGVPVTDHVVVGRGEAARFHVMEPPYVIKPLTGGGLIEVVLRGQAPATEALSELWTQDPHLMIERFVPGYDLSCTVQGDVALGIADASDRSSAAERGAIAAAVSSKIYDKAQKMSLRAHEALGCRGVTQVKFRFNDSVDEDAALVCLAVDTQPDLGEGGTVALQVRAAGQSYDELIAWMLEDASCDR